LQPSSIEAFIVKNYGENSVDVNDTLGGALLSALCIELVLVLLIGIPLLVIVLMNHFAGLR